MYFNAETQAKVMSRFHFALNGHDNGAGYLFLGRAEMLLTQSSLFTPLDLKCRVFLKVQPPGMRQRAPALALPVPNGNGGEMNRTQRLREMALEEIRSPGSSSTPKARWCRPPRRRACCSR
jgi:two-component system CheB/CheR fusion protein